MDIKDEKELAAVLAHEVKNPVAIIKANVDSIKPNISKDYTRNIEVINSAINRIENIIDSYRLINSLTDNTELIYVEDMLEEIIEDYNISSPNIDFVYKGYEDIKIRGNYNKLSILFYNLYKNALEAIAKRGVITTEVEKEGEYAKITIRDTGCGIENIESLGTPYYTTKEKGTGLGILICKSIIGEHKGKIEFKNNDIGSSVIVNIPLWK